ncbi:LytTR family DNA-binding domain-containing protein [Thermosyntropha sp.]|uniref:LytR/AlgR family response regulator transcription factor n=1 Tax=Thermosyntropha sp. TaxID=2740820 RepID=UPI0025E1418B|nr:LytTR family DNA-binding domain-containing protein [Thermosyntropha sp.]MBO8158947.1 response regulator transcription factor [Thermosyntropha sp.]
MKVLLLEDEEYTREFFVKILNQIPEVTEVIATSCGEEAISLTQEENPDLILLDIELDGQDINGLQVARIIFEHTQSIFIVFITGYAQYALDSFIVHPYDYILKPISKNRMIKLVQEIAAKKKKTELKPLILKSKNHIFQIDPSEIIFIEKQNNISLLHTCKRVHKTYYSLQELQDLLGDVFLRSHKSYLINLDWVDTIDQTSNRTYQVNFKNYQGKALMSRKGYIKYKKSF